MATTRTLAATVLTYRMFAMEEKFEAIRKRAKRLGVGSLAWLKGEVYQKEMTMLHCTKPVQRSVCDVTIVFEIPKIEGWEPKGVLVRPVLDGQAEFHGDEDTTFPAAWLDRKECSICDHCHTSRRRKLTVVLQHDDGRKIKVGSDCLKDFLGHNPTAALFGATLVGELREIFQFIPPPGSNQTWDLHEFVASAVADVRVNGFVPTSMRGAEDGTGKSLAPTADAVMDRLCPPVTEDDEAKAALVVAWAKSLTYGRNDYLNNVQAVAQDGYVTPKSAGVAASMVSAYDREHEPKPESASEYIGKVGERLVLDVEIVGTSNYSGSFGPGTVYRFRQGRNSLVWFATGDGLGRTYTKGSVVRIKGTVKAHSARQGVKQTILNRVSVT